MVCWNICQVPGEDRDEDQGGLNFGGHPIINIEYLHNIYNRHIVRLVSRLNIIHQSYK